VSWYLLGKIAAQIWGSACAITLTVVASRCNGGAVGLFIAMAVLFLVMTLWI
jgi:hypothetical protein